MGSSEHLSKGQLVRFLERTTGWYCARLRRVRDEDVDVTLFGGRSFRVPRNQVERIDAFFNGRERVWSVERARLTAFFYGREIERLHAGRLREMQRALSKAGIVFEPEVWPTADTRIRLRKDASVVERDGSESVLAGLLPQWLEPFVLPSGSRDPLGLQAPAERLVNEVLPGLTVFTFRAGYYGS